MKTVAKKALVLAAGEGTRLRPLTLTMPKAMLPLGGKPLLEHTLRWLKGYGFTEIAINLHYEPEVIVNYFKDGAKFGVKITYSRESQILGTAGALSQLRDFFDSTFAVIYGDIFTDLDLSSLIDFHRSRKPIGTIALFPTEKPQECGLVEIDPQGQIHRFVEKPAPEEVFTNLANGGIYLLEPAIMEFIPDNQFYDFGCDLFPALLRKGIALYGYPANGCLIDIGTIENYNRAKAIWGRMG